MGIAGNIFNHLFSGKYPGFQFIEKINKKMVNKLYNVSAGLKIILIY
ncbi:hypothetical protein ICMP_505 [Candidatus Ishikawaella capsulata Mpkobe]|uniref:Uncharacterized protein n=1 Tax=Candidatus Ishikawaella capsulata Mpkobe TaxID=476281 RepID=C5WDE6_9ENTR|nr:hypothetical protein ICMP_505 [Candidatus Ishikawaella capsulata Mpkobe]